MRALTLHDVVARLDERQHAVVQVDVLVLLARVPLFALLERFLHLALEESRADRVDYLHKRGSSNSKRGRGAALTVKR